MDGEIAGLRRDLRADPFDANNHFRLICALKRRAMPLLEEAVAAIFAGVPFGEAGIQRCWFESCWRAVVFRVNRLDPPKLLAGPFATLRGADLYASELRARDLRLCSLREANLQGADLFRADLSGALLQGAFLNGANLIRAQLNGAQLTFAQLSRVDFIHADLRGADLRGSILDRANLRNARLAGADLRGASLFASKIRPWPHPDVIVDSATIGPDGERADW